MRRVLVCAALSALPSCAPRNLGSFGSEGREDKDSAQATPDAAVDASATDTPDGEAPDVPEGCSAECNDKDPCNGLERCVGDTCVPGDAPCQNSDVQHCEVSCTVKGKTPVCSTLARDRDQDGHGDQACRGADVRGDDCDDDSADNHPGAPELCDGLDNDCNGKVDLQDGLKVQAESKAFGPGQFAAAAWSSFDTAGVAYLQDGDVWFGALDAHGEHLLEPTAVSLGRDQKGSALAASVTWGHDAFGVSFTRNGQLGFRTVSSEGEVIGDELSLGGPDMQVYGSSSVGRVGAGDWLVTYECCMRNPTIYGRRIDAQGKVLEPLYPLVKGVGISLSGSAVSGEQLATSWWRMDESAHPVTFSIEWARHTADLAPADDRSPTFTTVASPGQAQLPLLADAPQGGYAMAWTDSVGEDTGQHLRFAEFDHSGNVLCGPVDLSEHFPQGSVPVIPRQLVRTEHGHALITDIWLSSSLFAVDIIEARSGCQYGQRFRVAGTNGGPQAALVNGGKHGYMAFWQDYVNGEGVVMQRALGPNFCD